MLETVDTKKLANKLNNAVESIGRQPLSVMVQVNTSGEECESIPYGNEAWLVVLHCPIPFCFPLPAVRVCRSPCHLQL